ncbi:MAG: nitrite reductase small subunit NirD [Halioglobus sp.]|nr:nitrite reductase small subunit NirD [Halioglobus sp.]
MGNWTTVCAVDDIPPNSGRCALVGTHQVAVFRVRRTNKDEFYALDNHDPFSGANVLSRGIVGTVDDKLVVASPVYKQHFCLQTGACLEEDIDLTTWAVRVTGHAVQLAP